MSDSETPASSVPPPVPVSPAAAGEPTPSGEPPPPTGPPQEPRIAANWGSGRTFAGLFSLLVVVIIEAVVVSAFDPEIETLAARLTLQALLAISLIAVALIVAGQVEPGRPALELVGLRLPRGPVIGPMLIAYFAYIACALVIAALLEPEQEDITRELGVDEGIFGAVAAGLLIIVAAPLSEEIFFRGFLFGGLRRGAGFIGAALVSSGIWGLFHYTGTDSWGVVLQLALFGVALAWLYERTGSIWPPIAVHAFNNALAFTLLTS